MAAASPPGLIQRRERGWRMGLANVLANELRGWWGTRLGWLLAIGAPALVAGLLAILLFSLPPASQPLDGVQGLLKLIGLLAPLAVIVLMQDSLIGERQSGTAAWVLSKPVSRSAFILAKLLATSINVVFVLVVLPGLIGFTLLIALDPQSLRLPALGGALGLLALNTMFYVALMMVLGTVFERRGPVLGVGLGVALGLPMLLNLAPALTWLTPVPLADLGTLVAHGAGLADPLPVIATTGWTIAFVLVALWRFHWLEL
jgi:ABC-2 type transport system permease protein